jgi:hypothetical protein
LLNNKLILNKLNNFEDWVWWYMSVIPAASEAEIRRFAILGKKLARYHLNKQAGHGGSVL